MHYFYFWRKDVLLSKWMLWTLVIVNGLGTMYGYDWYSWQLTKTLQNEAAWLVLFVPDSPTASLFFTLAIAYLLRDQYVSRDRIRTSFFLGFVRQVIEALAVITSIKYGIWAVAMIALGTVQGDPFHWQLGMLVVSHLGMTVEAMLFSRFFSFRGIHIMFVAIWTLSNDVIDYTFGVFPSLSFPGLDELLPAIKRFTMSLSIVSIAYAVGSLVQRRRRRAAEK